MMRQNTSKYRMEPQRWGQAQDWTPTPKDQVAKPPLALMEDRGWPRARYFLLPLPRPEAAPAHQNLEGKEEGEQEH